MRARTKTAGSTAFTVECRCVLREFFGFSRQGCPGFGGLEEEGSLAHASIRERGGSLFSILRGLDISACGLEAESGTSLDF